VTPEQGRKLKAQLADVSKDARALTEGMDAAALTRRPPNGGWGVAECVQHLILTADAMIPLAEQAIAELERDGRRSDRPAGVGVMGWLLIKSLESPGMKTKTTKPFEPAVVPDPLTMTDRFVETNTKLETLISRAEGLATTTVKVVSPFNARVKYNAYAALRIILVHARRHLRQAREAKSAA
jgi:hypothetical protein